MDNHDFTSEELAACLDKGIYMLFFIEEDTFDRKDIQNVVFAMKSVQQALRKGGQKVE
ncbi:hypothetical protein [Seonamhaeicola sp.]|uniref:hypothetical protein n=1 Tax=Seonamhaeicola sp. TaxID=1912245 RepID=UPI002623CF3A|nr:hypothetical protein [Seonamhaeicola sp.]